MRVDKKLFHQQARNCVVIACTTSPSDKISVGGENYFLRSDNDCNPRNPCEDKCYYKKEGNCQTHLRIQYSFPLGVSNMLSNLIFCLIIIIIHTFNLIPMKIHTIIIFFIIRKITISNI